MFGLVRAGAGDGGKRPLLIPWEIQLLLVFQHRYLDLYLVQTYLHHPPPLSRFRSLHSAVFSARDI